MTDNAEFSEIEYDALKEMMNIGFGRAAATLSEIMDVNVILSVPITQVVDSAQIAAFIKNQSQISIAYSMVEQFFMGKFSGISILLLPEAEGKNLIGLFCPTPLEDLRTEELNILTQETIMEIGNILIGACVGMISELMGTKVSFRPPNYVSGEFNHLQIQDHVAEAGTLALVFKTIFHFDQYNIQGNLFLVTSNESILWLKTAIRVFLEELA